MNRQPNSNPSQLTPFSESRVPEAQAPAPNSTPANGRPPVLDSEKRQLLCSLVAAGYSRRRAAQQVGCSPSTITRTSQRDPSFAEQLRTAEMHNELAPLGHLRQAANRSWRAAAWLLERQHPNEYGRRNPDLVTRDELRDAISRVSLLLIEEINNPEDRSRVRQKIENLLIDPNPNSTSPSTPIE